jgi:hypothetical protein
MHVDTSWNEAVADLRELEYPFVEPLTHLLETSSGDWEARICAKRILLMQGMSGIGVGFRKRRDCAKPKCAEVQVSWSDDTFEFRLFNSLGLLVTADRCHEAKAAVVLDSFLTQVDDAVDSN